MDKKAVVLSEVVYILEKYGLEYTLICGTLLGCVREDRFLPWDSDIDLGIFDFDRLDKPIRFGFFQSYGFEVIKEIDGFWGYHYRLIKDGIPVDLFRLIHKKDGTVLFRFNWKNIKLFRAGKKYYGENRQIIRITKFFRKIFILKPLYYIFDYQGLTCTEFEGIYVMIPKNAYEWLHTMYGNNWVIRNPNYRYSDERQKNIKCRGRNK